MKVENVFSLKDFFNYYFPGFLWILCVLALLVPIGDVNTWHVFINKWNPILGQISSGIWLIVSIVFPYLFGFVLNPLGERLTKQFRKRDDALIWVLDPSGNSKHISLLANKRHLINEYVEKLFKVNNVQTRRYFWDIRAFIADHGGRAYELSERARAIVNLAEAMIVPLPLLALIVGFRLISVSLLLGILLVSFGIYAFFSLKERYLKLRGFWVKHVYRAFLVIASKEKLLNREEKV